MSVDIIIQFNAKEIVIPVNPSKLEIKRKSTNTDIDIAGIGKVTRKGEPELIRTEIKSFFPSKKSYFYTGTKPLTYINFINSIWHAENKNNNVAKIITHGLDVNLCMNFVIENFEYDHNAGDDDISYTLSIKQYIAYGVKYTDAKFTGMASARAKSTTAEDLNAIGDTSPNLNKQKTYTVQPGDSLFTITKKCTGNGSQWQALYELNKDKISNPNTIYAGQVLTLPTDWNTPVYSSTARKVTNKNTTEVTIPKPDNSLQIQQAIAKHTRAKNEMDAKAKMQEINSNIKKAAPVISAMGPTGPIFGITSYIATSIVEKVIK